MPRSLLVLCLIGAAASLDASPAAAQPTADAVFAALRVTAGATLCEIGAGDGALTLRAAAAVGAAGRVYASELGEARVDKLRAAVAASGLPHVTVVAGSAESANFPDAACEAIVLRDVYHHFSNPRAMNAAMARSLKAGGLVAMVDFTPPPGSRAPSPADRGKDGMHGIHPEDMTAEMQEAGFQVVASDVGQRWFMLVFERRAPLIAR